VDFGEFVRSRSRELLRVGWLLTGDWGLAEDLVQTALSRCWQRWESITAHDAYVRTAIMRAHLSWQRRRAAGELISTELEAPSADEVGPAEVRASVRVALAGLSSRERAVVVLRYYLDLSERDTATTLGISTGSVKRYAADALAKLRTAPSLRGLLTEELVR
jgi:RNA polymerase sigma-70 factor (sigma-E family)